VGGTRAAGTVGRGTGYTVVVPAGWNDGAARFAGGDVHFDLTYVRGRGTGLTANILVERTPGTVRSHAALAAAVRAELRGDAPRAQIRAVPGPRVDGARGVAFVVRRRIRGTPIVQRRVAVQHRGARYLVALTAPGGTFGRDDRTLDAFLRSWRWR
jgi:hypothetical protein